jgi:hypothetical protein
LPTSTSIPLPPSSTPSSALAPAKSC